MAAPTTAAEAIEQAALGPKSVTTKDGTTVIARDVPDLIQADNHTSGKVAATRKHFGIRFTKLIPPGGG
jgi:hypothetical protein